MEFLNRTGASNLQYFHWIWLSWYPFMKKFIKILFYFLFIDLSCTHRTGAISLEWRHRSSWAPSATSLIVQIVSKLNFAYGKWFPFLLLPLTIGIVEHHRLVENSVSIIRGSSWQFALFIFLGHVYIYPFIHQTEALQPQENWGGNQTPIQSCIKN